MRPAVTQLRKEEPVFMPKMGEAGWKTVRFALHSWPRTVRLLVLVLGVAIPAGVSVGVGVCLAAARFGGG